MIIDRNTEVLKGNFIAVPHCSPHIPLALHWERTRASTVRIGNGHVIVVNLSVAEEMKGRKIK
jgi:hypothetical protein